MAVLVQIQSVLANLTFLIRKRADLIELKERLKKAEVLFQEFNEVQTKIEETVVERDLNPQVAERDNFETDYFNAIANAKGFINEFKTEMHYRESEPAYPTTTEHNLPITLGTSSYLKQKYKGELETSVDLLAANQEKQDVLPHSANVVPSTSLGSVLKV
ncbi:hypothetical protein FQA39_LY10153 [Lamprigera yunnana]|nr:hypothetical protein FQA39_LY10153 [Lamprigera yunnana]